MPLVVANEAQHEMRAAGGHVTFEEFGDPADRPGIAGLALAHHRRGLSVVALEIIVEPGTGALGVLVEADVEIRAPRQRAGIAPRLPRDRLDLVPLPAPFRGVRRDRHPAVEVAPGALDARGQRAADPQRRAGWPVHSARIRRSPSIMRPTRLSNGTPQAANSARMFGTSAAMPTPRMKRPCDAWSS